MLDFHFEQRRGQPLSPLFKKHFAIHDRRRVQSPREALLFLSDKLKEKNDRNSYEAQEDQDRVTNKS